MYRDFCGICFLSSAAKCIAGKDCHPPTDLHSRQKLSPAAKCKIGRACHPPSLYNNSTIQRGNLCRTATHTNTTPNVHLK